MITPWSQVEICNAALGHINVRRQISDIEENTQEARQCKLHFDHALLLCLEAMDWTFARARVALDLDSQTPPEEWEYAYILPGDYVAAQGIADDLQVRLPDKRIRYRLETVNSVRYLYTNQVDAVLVYTRQIEDPARWPASFSEYLSWKLAEQIAMALTGKEALKDKAEVKAIRALHEAAAKGLGEEEEGPEPDPEFIAARR